ncbi:MAG TPA: hypothetical protein VF219_21200 [Vicinamibacterales bacterium]
MGASRVTMDADAWIPQSPVELRLLKYLETATAMRKAITNNAAHV